MNSSYTPVPPGKKPFKTLVARIILFVLGRGLQAASKLDPDVRREMQDWPQGLTVAMNIHPSGPRTGWRRDSEKITHLGGKIDPDAMDLVVTFKNVESAFMVFTAQVGTAKAYAEHRMSVQGDLVYSMTLIRCLNYLETHLFPRIISRMILKKVPKMGFKKQLIRLYIYLVGIPLGL